MKGKYILSSLLLISLFTYAQNISFLSHTVDTGFGGPAGIYLADLSSDSLPDVIAAGSDANTIAWWKNMGDNPLTWTKHIIDDDFRGAIYTSAGDIDGDSLTDVLGAAWQDYELAWWKNDGNDTSVWTKYIIKSGFVKAHEIMPFDVDMDGDMDVIGVSAGLNRISWFENDGNWPIKWTEHIITDDFEGARSVDARDIDGDGDIDMVGAALSDHEIAWWRNEGGDSITWTKFVVATGFTYAHKVQIVDIDKDEEPDILGTAYNKGLAWWKNDGEDSITWSKQFISYFGSAVIGYAIDTDDDNDLDIVCSAQTTNGKIGIWFNNGEDPILWDNILIEDDLGGSWPLHYGDIDVDGDIDLVCGGNSANEIKWYENDLITSTETTGSKVYLQPGIRCHPIPLEDRLQIFITLDKNQFVTLRIIDITGEIIKEVISSRLQEGEHQFAWDAQNFHSGIYFAQILSNDYTKTVKIIKTK